MSSRLAGQPDVVLLVDANARLGSAVSGSVGDGGLCQQEDISGSMFHRTLVELSLCVPATFGPPDPSAFTWVANGGATHRIDYVAVPCSWGCGPRECSRHTVAPRVGRDAAASCSVSIVDAAGDWEDHFLVALRAPLLIRWAPRGSSGNRKALIVPPSRILSAVPSLSAPCGTSRRPLGPCLLTIMSVLRLVQFVRPPGLLLALLPDARAGNTLMLKLGLLFVIGGLSKRGAVRGVFLPPPGASSLAAHLTPSGFTWASSRGVCPLGEPCLCRTCYLCCPPC